MQFARAHKIKLNPTNEQASYFHQASGIARYAYNWGLAEYNRILDYNRTVEKTDRISVSGRQLKKEFNQVKPDWVSSVSAWAYQGAFDDLQAAFTNYFRKQKNGELKPPKGWKPRKDDRPFGWPTFKAKHRTTPAFYQANQAIRHRGNEFRLPIVGWINATEPLRFDGDVLAGRVSYSQGHWWLSVQVEFEADIKPAPARAVSVDLGVKYLAVTSDGCIEENPRPLIKAQKKLRRLQRKLDRQRRANNEENYNEDGTIRKGSKEWIVSGKMARTNASITKLHARVVNIRQDASHKLTTRLAKGYAVVCLEDLNIQGMLKNGKLAKVISDAAFYEKRRQIEYKVAGRCGIVVFVDQWFPSSKRCSGCGWIYGELTLSEREWVCQDCGQMNDRDENAALNILDEGLEMLDVACSSRSSVVESSPVTRELVNEVLGNDAFLLELAEETEIGFVTVDEMVADYEVYALA